MKVLVTGGGGFLGGELVNMLLDRGDEVSNLSRKSYDSLTSKGIECIQCDLSQAADVAKLDLSNFDAIFHVAALAGIWGKRDDFLKINFEGTKNLYLKARKDGVKYFIYTSSPSVVFGDEAIEGADESIDYPKRYYSDYAESKAMAEKFLINQDNQGPLVLSLRPHLIWGKGDPHIFPRLIAKAKNSKLRRVGDGNNIVDIIHVKNAAYAHVLALDAIIEKAELHGRCYFLGQRDAVNLWSFIDDILTRNGLSTVNKQVSFKFAYIMGTILENIYSFFAIMGHEPQMTRFMALQLGKSHYFSHKRAEADLGYKPVIGTEEGLNLMYGKQGD